MFDLLKKKKKLISTRFKSVVNLDQGDKLFIK